MKLVLLAAGKSSRIFNKININKCLIKINKNTLIENLIKDAKQNGVKNIDVVVGYKSYNIKKQLMGNDNLNFIHNNKYKSTDMVYSAMLALKKSKEDTLISYTDIIYDKSIFSRIKKINSQKILLPYLSEWKKIWKMRKKKIFDDAETFVKNKKNELIEIGNKLNTRNINSTNGQFAGIIFFPRSRIKDILKFYFSRKEVKKIQFTEFLNLLIKNGYLIKVRKYKGFWYEIDDFEDLNNLKNIKYFKR